MSFLAKIMTSSVDPSRTSLLVKGVLVSFAPMVLLVLGVPQADFDPIIEALTNLVFYGTGLLGVIQVLYGGYRKLKEGRWSHPDA
jgi:hypothetical protein